jgi:hypothetical protein
LLLFLPLWHPNRSFHSLASVSSVEPTAHLQIDCGRLSQFWPITTVLLCTVHNITCPTDFLPCPGPHRNSPPGLRYPCRDPRPGIPKVRAANQRISEQARARAGFHLGLVSDASPCLSTSSPPPKDQTCGTGVLWSSSASPGTEGCKSNLTTVCVYVSVCVCLPTLLRPPIPGARTGQVASWLLLHPKRRCTSHSVVLCDVIVEQSHALRVPGALDNIPCIEPDQRPAPTRSPNWQTGREQKKRRCLCVRPPHTLTTQPATRPLVSLYCFQVW